MELEKVNLTENSGSYAQEFFSSLVGQGAGEFFAYGGNLGKQGRSVRSAAAHWGKKLGRKFAVRKYRTPEGQSAYAVGVIEAPRRKRGRKPSVVTQDA